MSIIEKLVSGMGGALVRPPRGGEADEFRAIVADALIARSGCTRPEAMHDADDLVRAALCVVFADEARQITMAFMRVEDTPAGQLYLKMQHACPACGIDPPKYRDGPRGGLAVNVFCMSCDQGFNITREVGIAEAIPPFTGSLARSHH